MVLEHGFIAFGNARNTMIHEGRLPEAPCCLVSY